MRCIRCRRLYLVCKSLSMRSVQSVGQLLLLKFQTTILVDRRRQIGTTGHDGGGGRGERIVYEGTMLSIISNTHIYSNESLLHIQVACRGKEEMGETDWMEDEEMGVHTHALYNTRYCLLNSPCINKYLPCTISSTCLFAAVHSGAAAVRSCSRRINRQN